jgi:2-oxoglutarate dehydrogenase E2 component (dihydrolipoamide succinyltransferase)
LQENCEVHKLTFLNIKTLNMAKYELIMPKMGESIVEATIIKWHKNVGETIEQDETILEIATDKVDSEIASPVSGKIIEIYFKENDVVPIDTIIALIAVEGEESVNTVVPEVLPTAKIEEDYISEPDTQEVPLQPIIMDIPMTQNETRSDKFYSPLVRNMAKEENLSIEELDNLQGTGASGRLTKNDLLKYLAEKDQKDESVSTVTAPIIDNLQKPQEEAPIIQTKSTNADVEIIEMDRMRKLISDHMIMSKKVSAHVTSFVEADVTNMVKWREKNKDSFAKKFGEKITYTPLFIEAMVQALRDFPKINCSLENDKIHVFRNLNIGMAAALPNGNLIVPVIKNADYYNLAGLTKQVNDLALRARENKLKPDEIKDGTFTFTNIGTFGNVMGTPIINQPQAAILALGAIKKKPAVLETEYGDVIAVRHMMFMSLSYDHRIIDGFLGGSFLKRIADLIEGFDINRLI